MVFRNWFLTLWSRFLEVWKERSWSLRDSRSRFRESFRSLFERRMWRVEASFRFWLKTQISRKPEERRVAVNLWKVSRASLMFWIRRLWTASRWKFSRRDSVSLASVFRKIISRTDWILLSRKK